MAPIEPSGRAGVHGLWRSECSADLLDPACDFLAFSSGRFRSNAVDHRELYFRHDPLEIGSKLFVVEVFFVEWRYLGPCFNDADGQGLASL